MDAMDAVDVAEYQVVVAVSDDNKVGSSNDGNAQAVDDAAMDVEEQLRSLASAGLADSGRITTLERLTEQLLTRLTALETNLEAVSLRLDAIAAIPAPAPPPPAPAPPPPPAAPQQAQEIEEQVRILIEEGRACVRQGYPWCNLCNKFITSGHMDTYKHTMRLWYANNPGQL